MLSVDAVVLSVESVVVSLESVVSVAEFPVEPSVEEVLESLSEDVLESLSRLDVGLSIVELSELEEDSDEVLSETELSSSVVEEWLEPPTPEEWLSVKMAQDAQKIKKQSVSFYIVFLLSFYLMTNLDKSRKLFR